MIVFLNGKYCAAGEARVSLFDGGYLYGDGMFETIRLYVGRPFDLAGHLARMSSNLETLGYAYRPSPPVIGDVIAELVRRNGLESRDARCRLTVSRGGGPGDPLPLSGHGALPPTVSIFLQPLDPVLALWQRDGISVLSMRAGFSRGDFPHLKTLNYLTTVTALRLAHAAGCQEALLVDGENRVLEGATSNVFLVRTGSLYTPPLALGLLAGRTRDMILALAAAGGIASHEAPLSIADLCEADEAFLCGSVKEIVPIVAVDGSPVGDGMPGPVTRYLLREYRRGVMDSLGGI
ncbi:aminotransferase class IV [bacterium]|nr:aminotransferase class IV [bacterium]MBU1073416.1 aminotransferase class IV [bacterium]MBU1675651.1 aminotransferase class IV [bacterium]